MKRTTLALFVLLTLISVPEAKADHRDTSSVEGVLLGYWRVFSGIEESDFPVSYLYFDKKAAMISTRGKKAFVEADMDYVVLSHEQAVEFLNDSEPKNLVYHMKMDRKNLQGVVIRNTEGAKSRFTLLFFHIYSKDGMQRNAIKGTIYNKVNDKVTSTQDFEALYLGPEITWCASEDLNIQ